MNNTDLINDSTDTVAALLNQATADIIYMRTGQNASGVLEAYIDTLKVPVRPVRFNAPITLDYSFQGKRYIVKGSIIETAAPHHAIVGISQSDIDRIHINYGSRVRELLGDISSFLSKEV